MTDYNRTSPASQPENNAHAMQSQGGQVIPFSVGKDVSRDEVTTAVQLWRFDRDLSDALTRQELGSMKMLDRIDAQRKTLLIGFAMYLRKHPRSDVAMGVYLVTTLLSDNDSGMCTVSQPTMAKMFDRSVSSIADAQRRLREDGMILTSRGRYAGAMPVIPRLVTKQYNNLTWIVGALASDDKTANHPAPPVDCQSSGPTGGLSQSSGQTLGLKSVNHPVEPPSIIRPDPMQSHSNNSTTLKEETVGLQTRRAIASVAIGIASVATPMAAAAQPTPPAIFQPANREIPYTELKAKLMEAGGEAIGTNAGLEVLSLPRAWLADGCDLMEDILPVIRARSAKRPMRSIQSWSFFTQAIADAKATRLSAIPKGSAICQENISGQKSNNTAGGRAKNWHDEQDELRAKFKALRANSE